MVGLKINSGTLPEPNAWQRAVLMAFLRRSLPGSKDYHPPRAMKILTRWMKLIDCFTRALEKHDG